MICIGFPIFLSKSKMLTHLMYNHGIFSSLLTLYLLSYLFTLYIIFQVTWWRRTFIWTGAYTSKSKPHGPVGV